MIIDYRLLIIVKDSAAVGIEKEGENLFNKMKKNGKKLLTRGFWVGKLATDEEWGVDSFFTKGREL